jgi:TolB-like protein/Flp pilus assembly protein TadD
LRRALLILGRIAGSNLLTDDPARVALVPAAIDSDVARLVSLASTAGTGELASLLELCSGPLLAGFPPITPPFDDWLARMRKRTEGLVTAARQRLPSRPPVPPSTAARPRSGPPWVAVLPFTTRGPDLIPRYFADGLVEDIVLRLTAVSEPVVMSSSATLIFRDQPADIRHIAGELGVHYVINGSIRQSGSALRLTVELVEGTRGSVLWGQSYETTRDTLFDAQDSIATTIVSTVVPYIHSAELRRVRAQRPSDMTAYDLFLQARDMMFRLDRAIFEDAGGLIRQAASRDAGFAPAHALLADWHSLRVGQGWSPDATVDTMACDAAALRAIACNRRSARALAIHAHTQSYLHRNYDIALGLFDRALDASPNDAAVWMWSASTYAYIGEGREAVRRGECALSLSPRDPFIFRFHSTLCLAHYTAGNYDEAARWGLLSAHTGPSYTSNLRFTAAALVAAGRAREAAQLARRVTELQPGFSVAVMLAGHPYRDADRRHRIARELLEAGLPA